MNFDLEPLSVEFIDPFTGEYASPAVQALVDTEAGPRDLVVHSHPDTNRPFFCVPGIRQYHDQPQHSGDSWLLHRQTHEGSLATSTQSAEATISNAVRGRRQVGWPHVHAFSLTSAVSGRRLLL